MLAFKEGDRVRLLSRAGKDHTRRFADLAAAIRALRASTLILDGEVARYDAQLVSRFEWLRENPKDEVATSPMFMAFDLLQFERTTYVPSLLGCGGCSSRTCLAPPCASAR